MKFCSVWRSHWAQRAKRAYEKQQRPQVRFTSVFYRARNWKKRRRVWAKAEHSGSQQEVYFVLTNQRGRAREGCAFYNGRGECENRIAEVKNGFHADRLSCHRFLANAFRLALHGLAYNLVNLFRLHLPEPLRPLQISSLREKVFKVGARILQTARRIWVHFSTGWPYRPILTSAAQACG
jgi:Transposase DDE domain group 1